MSKFLTQHYWKHVPQCNRWKSIVLSLLVLSLNVRYAEARITESGYPDSSIVTEGLLGFYLGFPIIDPFVNYSYTIPYHVRTRAEIKIVSGRVSFRRSVPA